MSNNCLKEYASNDCYVSEIKYIKNKLHTRYLIGISVGFIVLSILLVTKGDATFSSQLSMGSTISSIILSAIAIFMSISGENKMSGIQNQMIETSTKMSKVANQIENLNENMLDSLTEKLKVMDTLIEKMDGVKGDVNIVKETVNNMFKSFPDNIKANNKFSKEDLYKLYLCLMNSNWPKESKDTFRLVVLIFITSCKIRKKFSTELILKFTEDKGGEPWGYFYIGMLILFNVAGLKLNNDDMIEYIKEKIGYNDEEIEQMEEFVNSFV